VGIGGKYAYPLLPKELLINMKNELQFGTGAVVGKEDHRDRFFDGIAFGAAPFDWDLGYDVRNIVGNINIKNQDGSLSCVGQGWSYQVGVLNAVEMGSYTEVSAKAFYSQIYLPQGGAYIRDGAKLAVNWGSNFEQDVSSYIDGKPPTEAFMKKLDWKDENATYRAEILRAKEYRAIQACDNMDLFAIAIRDNFGVVGGVAGTNNGTWNSLEPKPPTSEADIDWHHCLYYGWAGKDNEGKFIATPNSWGTRGGWQKLREDYFNKLFQFDPWTLTDQPNQQSMSNEAKDIIDNFDKYLIVEGVPPGRKGIMVSGKLMEITRQVNEPRISAAEASLYVLTNQGFGKTVSKKVFDELPKGNNF